MQGRAFGRALYSPFLGSSATARIAGCCAAALAIFVLWVAIGSSAQVGVAFFYAIPVGLATWWFGWRVGLGFAAACTGLYLIGTAINPVAHFAGALAVRAVVLLAVVAVFAAVRERVLSARAFGGGTGGDPHGADAALDACPSCPESTSRRPSSPPSYGVSGDFYLLTNGPDGSTVAVVGDVVGHGPKAARLATFVRARSPLSPPTPAIRPRS